MPFYTFECPECKHVVEVLQNMSDPEPCCNKCTKMVPRKIVEMKRVWKGKGPGIKLMGEGFHNNDYGQYGPKKPEI